MGISTVFIVALFLAVLVWLGRRGAKRKRTETAGQREKRIKNENETAAAMAIVDDD